MTSPFDLSPPRPASLRLVGPADQFATLERLVSLLVAEGYECDAGGDLKTHPLSEMVLWTDLHGPQDANGDRRVIVVTGRSDWPEHMLESLFGPRSHAEDQIAPVILRTEDALLPEWLLPAVANIGFAPGPVVTIDAFRNPGLAPERTLEAVAVRPIDPSIATAIAAICGSMASAQLMANLSGVHATTTVEALHAIDPTLPLPVAVAIAAITRRDPQSLFQAASSENDRAQLQSFRFTDNGSLLHLASQWSGSVECGRVLVEVVGLAVDEQTHLGSTPLVFAAWANPDLGLYLIERGANAAYVRPDGQTCLSYAAWRGHNALAKAALAAGAPAGFTDSSGGMPLSWAIIGRHAEIAEMILESRPDVLDVASGDFGLGSPDPTFSSDQPGLHPLVRLRRRLIETAAGELGRTPLMVAARQPDPQFVERWASRVADINARDRTDATALMLASYRPADEDFFDDVRCVDAILRAGADLEATDAIGRTALEYAAIGGSADILQRLLSAGANIGPAPGNPSGPLHAAAALADTVCLERLLKADASVDPVDVDGFTPLFLAVAHGSSAHVALLLEYGANADKVEKSGRTPVFQLANDTVVEQVEKLALLRGAGANLDHQDPRGTTVLGVAVAKALTGLVEALLEGGASPDGSGAKTATPLHLAVRDREHPALVFRLIAAGAELDRLDEYGDTPLRDAYGAGNFSAFQELLRAGSNPWRSVGGKLPLAFAILGEGRDAFTTLLLDQIDLPSALEPYWRLTLSAAAAHGREDLVEAIRKRGYSLDDVAENSLRPVAAAAMFGEIGMLRRLHALGAQLNWAPGLPSAITCAAEQGQVEALGYLLDQGVPVNQPGRGQRTALHFAATHNQAPATRLLLQRGAYVDAVDHSSKTPLHDASAYGASDTVALLVDAGAVVDAMDEEGSTPLFAAARNGHALSAARLIEAGARVEGLRNDGTTPFMIAVALGRAEAADRLVEAGAAIDVTRDGLTPLDFAWRRGDEAMVALLQARKVAPRQSLPADSSLSAGFLDWSEAPADDASRFQRIVASFGAALPAPLAAIRIAPATFCPGAVFVAVASAKAPEREALFLWNHARSRLIWLDGSPGSVTTMGRLLPAGVSANQALDYLSASLFFKEQNGRRSLLLQSRPRSADDLSEIDTAEQGLREIEPPTVTDKGDGYEITAHVVHAGQLSLSTFFLATGDTVSGAPGPPQALTSGEWVRTSSKVQDVDWALPRLPPLLALDKDQRS